METATGNVYPTRCNPDIPKVTTRFNKFRRLAVLCVFLDLEKAFELAKKMSSSNL